MSNKELQHNRNKKYFVDAAKEIIKGEGIQAVNVRNVSLRAGYSNATMYSYFADLKEVIFNCVEDFQKECRVFINESNFAIPKGPEKIKATIKSFAKYFVQYPGIFTLFYIEKMESYGNIKNANELICNFFDRVCDEPWEEYLKEHYISDERYKATREILRHSVLGLLFIYLSRRCPSEYKEFTDSLDVMLDYLL